MHLEQSDKLVIDYGYRHINARPANGLDHITSEPTVVKVILEGDSSYHPHIVKVSNIVSINGKPFKEETQ